MRYYDFRDVMLFKGYSIVDVFDCIRDFYCSDACSNFYIKSLNKHVAMFCDHIVDRFVIAKKHYDIDDAFNKLLDEHFAEKDFYHNRSVDDCFDDLCYDVWMNCDLDHFLLDDYWQDLLKDC